MLTLQCFPVQYPPGHWRIDRGRQDFRPDRWSLEIFFRNSFGHARSTKAHRAIDIMGAVGLAVVSTTSGQVAPYYFAGPSPQIRLRRHAIRDGHRRFFGADYASGSGNIVLIIDDFGYLHYYAHLFLRAVEPGNWVGPGTTIGYLGKTGSLAAWGPSHLHYQVMEPVTDRGPYGVTVPFRNAPVSTSEVPKRPVDTYQQLRDLAIKSHALTGSRGASDIVLIPFDHVPRTMSGFDLDELRRRREQLLNPRLN